MIRICTGKYSKFNFPVGEISVRVSYVDDYPGDVIETIVFRYENDAEIIELLMLVNALKEVKVKAIILFMEYVPFSRQDRINEIGEAFSLKVFCNLINSCGFSKVIITDPHSDVTPALLNNCSIISQASIWRNFLSNKKDYFIVSPDAGSMKKINKLCKTLDYYNIIECSKRRDPSTGQISGVHVNIPDGVVNLGGDYICYIIDDICDGGKTFIEIARELKRHGASKVVLLVTHGFFTKGLEVFDGLIDEIHTSKGQVK